MLGYVGIGTLSEGMCRYDLNEEDVAWLEVANREFSQMGECVFKLFSFWIQHNPAVNLDTDLSTQRAFGDIKRLSQLFPVHLTELILLLQEALLPVLVF